MKTIESVLFPSPEHDASKLVPCGVSGVRASRGRSMKALDASALLRHAAMLRQRSRKAASASGVEVFHRSSTRVRVSIEPPEWRPRYFEAREDGVAVRLDLGERGIAFAACSGGDGAAVDRALARAIGAVPQVRPEGQLWATRTRSASFDLEHDATLPSREDLEHWLERATASFARCAGGEGHVVGPAWVEAGYTIETLVADTSLTAFRSRRRVWGLAMVRPARTSMAPERPRIVAARTLGALPIDGWSEFLDGACTGPGADGRAAAGSLVVASEAAATLVASLAATLHGPERSPGSTVGRAWRLRDVPRWPKGLSGGRFDDAGFSTHSSTLADGSRVVEVLGAQGHFRRPSFRDLPTPMFTTLVVEEADDPMPSRGMMADALRVHRLHPGRWVLDLEGNRLERGLPSGDRARLRLAVRPLELVLRCARAVGPARLYPNGVATPMLVFEGILPG
jgi:hypothetical protein